MACININSPEFQKILEETNNDVLLASYIYNETYGDLTVDTLNEDSLDLKETTRLAGNKINFAAQSENWNYQKTDAATIIDNFTLSKLIKSDGQIVGNENQEKFNQVSNAIGIVEAYRDYFENNKVIRPSKVIQDKLEKRIEEDTFMAKELPKLDNEIDLTSDAAALKFVVSDFDNIIKQNNEASALKLAEALSNKLNIPYEIISQEKLAEMFPNQPARKNFYRSGTVYLVEGSLNPNSVFHEFAHPIIKSMSKQNIKLFEELFNELSNTRLGEQIMSDLGMDSYYEEGTLQYKEEAIVMALEAMNENKVVAEELSNKSWLEKALFKIKQFLRKVFGRKIDISKLDSKTSLSQFVDMINYGKEFILDKQFLEEDMFTMFQTDYTALKEQMKQGSRIKTQEVMNSFYELVRGQLNMFQADNDIFKLIEEDLADENREGLLQQIEALMRGISTVGAKRPVLSLEKLEIEGDTKLEKDVIEFDKRVRAFVEALSMGVEIMNKFSEKLDVLERSNINENSKEADVIFALNQYLDAWQRQILLYQTQYLEAYTFDGRRGPLHDLLSDLTTQIAFNSRRAKTLQHNYVVDVLYDTLKEQMKPVKQDFMDQMNAHRNSGNLTMYNKLHTEYYGISVEEYAEKNRLENKLERIKQDNPKANLELSEQVRLNELTLKSYDAHDITKDQLKALMRGELSDANVLSSLMESFMNSQDKITSTFNIYLQKTFQTIDGNAAARRAELYKDLEPLMRAAGYMKIPNRFAGEGKVGRELGQQNISYTKDNSGKVQEFLEWRFKNNFINYEYDLEILKERILDAKKNYDFNSTPENFRAWIEAERVYEQFQLDYMHRDNLPIYYETRNKYLSDELGIEAKEAENEVLDRMRLMQDNTVISIKDMSAAMEALWQEYYQLSNIYDIYGEKKTGQALQIAERLNEYRTAMQEFYEWEEKEGEFEDELSKFILSIEAEVGTAAWNEELRQWLLNNTQVSVKEEYYQKREDLLEKRSILTQKLDEFNKEFGGLDVVPLYEQIYSIIKPTRDDLNQYDGNKLTKEAQQKIKDLHEQIADVKEKWIGLLGVDKSELRSYRAIENKLMNNQKVTDEELNFYENFWTLAMYTRAQEFGLSEGELDLLKQINREIQNLSISGLTPSYIITFTKFATSNPEIAERFNQMNKGVEISEGELPLPNELFDLARDTSKMQDLFELSEEFKEWFLRNHYAQFADEYDTDGNFIGEYLRWRATAVWQYTQPSDLEYYNAKEASQIPKIDENSNVNFLQEFTENGYIEINGVPRVPTRKYSRRKVKEEYKTPEILKDFVDGNGNLVLATKDNRGRWLPRDYNPNLEGSAKNADYIDASYKEMFNNQRAKFDLLDYLKNNHLNNQEGLDAPQKMYLSYPRFRKGKIEQYDRDYFRMKWLRFRDTFRVAADDFEDGLNMNRAKPNKEGYRTLTRPIAGQYLLPIIDVSTNIISIMMDYAYSIEQYKGMRKVNSTANMVKNSLISENPQENIQANLFRRVRQIAKDTALMSTEQEMVQRISNIEAMIDNHLKGIKLKTIRTKSDGTVSENAARFNAMLMKLVGLGAKRMAFMSFALDFVKSLRNYFGGKLMTWKKSAEGRYYNAKDMALTRPLAFNVMQELIRKQFNNEIPSAILQLLDVAGAVPSGLKKEIGGRWGRNVGISLREGGFWYADRRYLNDSVVVHQFLAMLEHARFDLNGKKVSLAKAVELRDGKLYTKEGVPADMAITYNAKGEIQLGSKLRDIMNAHQSYIQKNVGVASEYTEPEAYRWVLGKFTLFLLKFYPGMVLDKYQIRFRKGKTGQRRINLQTKQAEVGTYIAIFKLMEELWNGTYNPANLSWQARKGTLQLILALISQYLIRQLYMNLMFRLPPTGDEDDDDEYVSYYDILYSKDQFGNDLYAGNHLTGVSAPLQSFLLSPSYKEDWSVPEGEQMPVGYITDFSWNEWLKLQALTLLQGIENEERTFNPWQASVIAKDIATLQSPLADGGPLKELYNLGNQVRDLISSDEERNKKAINHQESGPFFWQEEGDWKGWTTVGKIFGLKGNIVYPQQQIKAQERYFED